MPGPRLELGPPCGDGILSPNPATNDNNDLAAFSPDVASTDARLCPEVSDEMARELAHLYPTPYRITKTYLRNTLWRHIRSLFRGRCAYCGRAPRLIIKEHMVPRSRGGSNGIENIVPACQSCNATKGNRTPLEWFLGLKPGVAEVCP